MEIKRKVHTGLWMIMCTKEEERGKEDKIMGENNCRLRVSKVQLRDRGFYHCQLATHPPQVRCYFLAAL